VREARGPLRLCGDGTLGQVVCAVVLVRVSAEQFHLGLRRSAEPHEPVVHLAWHRRLCDEPLTRLMDADGDMRPAAAIALAVDPLVNDALRILARRVAGRYSGRVAPPIFYGFGETSATFERATGLADDPDVAFTCATFVVALLRSVGIEMLDANRWREPTAEDLRWQRDIGQRLLEWIERQVHGDLLQARERVARDIGARRYRPTDVAAAALFGPDTWPVGVREVDPRARELEAMLTSR
jgi:hypothetical protein